MVQNKFGKLFIKSYSKPEQVLSDQNGKSVDWLVIGDEVTKIHLMIQITNHILSIVLKWSIPTCDTANIHSIVPLSLCMWELNTCDLINNSRSSSKRYAVS